MPPREARCFRVPAGYFFRIRCTDGSQVGDLNLWHAGDLAERFYSGKTRALHGSSRDARRPALVVLALPAADGDHHPRYLGLVRRRPLRRPRARRDRYPLRSLHASAADRRRPTIIAATRTSTRALAAETGLSLDQGRGARPRRAQCLHVHGFTADTGQYFMKASPARPATTSSCSPRSTSSVRSRPARAATARPSTPPMPPPAIRCGSRCWNPPAGALAGWQPSARNGYDRRHGPEGSLPSGTPARAAGLISLVAGA